MASALNVKLSWLNTGQIYCTIDAFGPLQPALVDIRYHLFYILLFILNTYDNDIDIDNDYSNV